MKMQVQCAPLRMAEEHVVGAVEVEILSFTATRKPLSGPCLDVEGPGSGVMCTSALIFAFCSMSVWRVEICRVHREEDEARRLATFLAFPFIPNSQGMSPTERARRYRDDREGQDCSIDGPSRALNFFVIAPDCCLH